jgi:Flp pilus assembly secretin CpaC
MPEILTLPDARTLRASGVGEISGRSIILGGLIPSEKSAAGGKPFI